MGLAHPTIHPYGVFPTSDKARPVLVSVQNEREFASLCATVLRQVRAAAPVPPCACRAPLRAAWLLPHHPALARCLSAALVLVTLLLSWA